MIPINKSRPENNDLANNGGTVRSKVEYKQTL